MVVRVIRELLGATLTCRPSAWRGRGRRHYPDRQSGADDRPVGCHPRRAAGERARLRHRPDVRRRDDRVTTVAEPSRWARRTSRSPAASSTWGDIRWGRASTPTRGSSPSASSTSPRCSWDDRGEPARPAPRSPRSAPTPTLSPASRRSHRLRGGQDPARPGPDGGPHRRARLGLGERGRAAAARDHARGPALAQDAVPPHGGSPRATPPASTTARPAPSSPRRRSPSNSASPPRCAWSTSPSPRRAEVMASARSPRPRAPRP